MPLISYIVPCYNVPAEMLRACIDSLLAIDLNDEEREVIVVDDGSEMPCSEVLNDWWGNGRQQNDKRLNDRHVNVIRQSNQGLSVARNTGIEHANGRYIHFVDADDMLIREPYNWCIAALKREQPNVLAFDFTTALSSMPSKDFRVFSSGAEYMLGNNLHVAACTYIFRKDILDELRFVPDLKNEDERFTALLFIRAGKTVVSDTKAYYYRQREGSLQHTYDEAFVDRRLADFASTLNLFNGMTFTDNVQQCAMRRRVHQMTMDYIYNTIVLTRSGSKLKEAIGTLRSNGLFPMVHACYTIKYLLFSYIANCSIGRALLLWALPRMKQEV